MSEIKIGQIYKDKFDKKAEFLINRITSAGIHYSRRNNENDIFVDYGNVIPTDRMSEKIRLGNVYFHRDVNEEVRFKSASCYHEFKEYVGLVEVYKYCFKCDVKKSDIKFEEYQHG